MIAFLKKNYILLSIGIFLNIVLLTLCVIPVKKEITTPGGIHPVDSLIEIEDGIKLEGSINTIYVYSYNYVTLMQSWLASNAKDIAVDDDSSEYFNLSISEEHKSGLIQKDQSIEACLIAAYKQASLKNDQIKLDASFSGFIVRLYEINQKELKVGDIIYQIDSLQEDGSFVTADITDPEKLSTALNKANKGDILYYTRKEEKRSYTVLEDFDYQEKKNCFYCYAKYTINSENSFPKFKINSSNTTGPSGGLLQAIEVYCKLTGQDLTQGKKIAGTGMIYASGKVGNIGAIEQKVVTALNNGASYFICPADQYDAAEAKWKTLIGHEKMQLIKADNLSEALIALGAEL